MYFKVWVKLPGTFTDESRCPVVLGERLFRLLGQDVEILYTCVFVLHRRFCRFILKLKFIGFQFLTYYLSGLSLSVSAVVVKKKEEQEQE